ncbi:hypothetical protein G6F56_002534 [Rhizopus delemar]|nr:hypothetical protein G6F56_002534 [Rhizopus delemar]
MSNFYWYSTNGMVQSRLPSRHFAILDQAFERRTRIQIYDEEVFGANMPALANPYQGTMTAGDLHFGLYRHPPVWRMSDVSLDTLNFISDGIFMDDVSEMDDKEADHVGDTTTENSRNLKMKMMQRKRLITESEEDCICCCKIS